MSVILDALKKLEREKAERRTRRLDLGEEILNARRSGKRYGSWKMWATLSVVVALTATVTISATILLLPKSPPFVPAVESRRMEKTRVLVAESQRTVQKERNPSAEPAAPIAVPAAPPVMPEQALSSREKQSTAEKEQRTTAVLSSPDFKVSGIAWNENRADRRAVVNGLLVGEGAVVEGAKIVRIYNDKVRFSSSGRIFEAAIAGSGK